MNKQRYYLVYPTLYRDSGNAEPLRVLGSYEAPPWKECRKDWSGHCLYSYDVRAPSDPNSKANGEFFDERFEGVIK